MTKLIEEYAEEYAKEIKEYLTKFPDSAQELYGIKVPKNLNIMNDEEFLKYILSIQMSVYKAVKEMQFATPFYYQINQYLFACRETIQIGVVNELDTEQQI